MCKILHIETATEICSASIADNGKLLAVKETSEGRSHAGVLAMFIQELFQETGLTADGLTAIAVSKGPGSYTGLRIGVSVAKGLCYGTGLPLIGINTLDSLYYGLVSRHSEVKKENDLNCLFVPMIDARRMEVYAAIYRNEHEMLKDTHALVVEPTTFDPLLVNYRIYFFGSGADKLTETIIHPNACFIKNFLISSSFMIVPALQAYREAKFEDLAYFEPYYLKDFITTTPKKKL
jgi:tRNA threonylcarbamoyladenosine biosynthesis protein TsaB